MPKYYQYQIAGYYLYYTSHCVIECMHVHASDRKLTESGSAKFFVNSDGSTVIQSRGILNEYSNLFRSIIWKCLKNGLRTATTVSTTKNNP